MPGINVKKILSGPSEYDAIALAVERGSDIGDIDSLTEYCNAMTQIFGSLAKTGRFTPMEGDVDGVKIAQWLREQLKEYTDVCLKFVASPDEAVSRFAFEAAMKVVMIEGKYMKLPYEQLLERIISVQLESPEANLESCWFDLLTKYDDIRFHFFRIIGSVVPALSSSSEVKDKLFDLFETFEAYPSSDYNLDKWFCGTPKVTKSALKSGKGNITKVGSHQLAAQRAWLAFLNLPLNSTEIKRILSVLHLRAIPNIAKPQLLMDFLTDSYNYGGPIALLALNSLFLLIQEHNLDYPKFFEKLYLLLGDGSLFASTHRARFLRLLDLFLTSTHLPGTIPASIIKRMARLCLFSPPGAIVAVLPFIYNQLKRHPTCMVMIHRNIDIQGVEADPFNIEETDPLQTKAIESSLWELDALMNHYQPNVSALAKIFSQPFHKPYYQLEHFLSHSYETLYSTQQSRKGRGGAALDYEEIAVFSDDGFLSNWTP